MFRLGKVPVGGSNPVRVMGILNTSLESFYKKSIKTTKTEIAQTVRKMEDEGADIVDVGAMSTAPYLSTTIPEKIESARITEAIKTIQSVSNLPISVDTCRANVAVRALDLGVDVINDISGLKYDKNMPHVIERYHPSLVLCAFSKNLVKGDYILATKNLITQSIDIAKSSHISRNNIVVDPAIGFFRRTGKGKFFTKINSDWLLRDLTILNNLNSIKQGLPLLVSVSNKSFLGQILGIKDPSKRLAASLAAEVCCVLKGADLIRTHNVRETKKAVTLAQKFNTNKSL